MSRTVSGLEPRPAMIPSKPTGPGTVEHRRPDACLTVAWVAMMAAGLIEIASRAMAVVVFGG